MCRSHPVAGCKARPPLISQRSRPLTEWFLQHKKRQSFRSALGSCYKSAFDRDIDQLALDVDFLGNGLAGDGFGHGGLGLGGSNGVRALDGGGHLDAGLDLAKLEGRENAAELRAEVTARVGELREKLTAADHDFIGAHRLLRAFPDMKSLNYADTLAATRAATQRLRELAAAAKAAAKETAANAAKKIKKA